MGIKGITRLNRLYIVPTPLHPLDKLGNVGDVLGRVPWVPLNQ